MFILFFFKQKTAYEMRISDWSSDVCSSDLQDLGALHLLHPGLERRALRQTVADRTAEFVVEVVGEQRPEGRRVALGERVDDHAERGLGTLQEGDRKSTRLNSSH